MNTTKSNRQQARKQTPRWVVKDTSVQSEVVFTLHLPGFNFIL